MNLLLTKQFIHSLALYNVWVGLLLSLLNSLLLTLASYKFLQAMQQSGYKGKEYFLWLRRKDNSYIQRLLMLSLLSFLAFLVFNISFLIVKDSVLWTLFGFVFYVVFTGIYIKYDYKLKNKLPLCYTARMRRLIFSHFSVMFVGTFICTIIINFAAYWLKEGLIVNLRYGFICLTPLLLPISILVAYYVNEPLERHNYNKYVRLCRNKLAEYPNLIKIGITGSYGKTSIKEILRTILSEKYTVLASPYSYNTPMGISKTVKMLDGTQDVFIAEMGARNVGDIRELADIVKPSYAVVSGVIAQHIETFKSLSNIKKTKYELIEALPNDGFAVFTSDNENTLELYAKCDKPKQCAGIDRKADPYVYADGIFLTETGTEFVLHIGDKSERCKTVLLGSHNVSNICLAVAVAVKLGMTIEEIVAGIERIAPVKHRMELVRTESDYTVIDDSYNSNVNGTIAALEVLNCFKGRKKIVVTPGFVELGKFEDHENYEFGKRLSACCDYVVLVGKQRVSKIAEGLHACDFPDEKVIIVKDLEDAKVFLKKNVCSGDVVLFENDLPDKYAM